MIVGVNANAVIVGGQIQDCRRSLRANSNELGADLKELSQKAGQPERDWKTAFGRS